MSLVHTIARNTWMRAGADALGKVASLAFYAVMARELGQTGFGAFTLALALALVLTTVAGFGTDEILARTVARDRATAPRILNDALTINVVLGMVAVLGAVAFAFVAGYDAEVRAAVALLAVATVVELAAKSVYATFQGHDDMGPVAASLVIQRWVTAIVGVVAMLLGAGVVTVSAVYLGGALLAFAYAALRLAQLRIEVSRALSPGGARALLGASLALGITAIVQMVLWRVDAVLLSLLDGNVAVGVYGVAYRLLESTLFVTFSLSAALMPTLSRASRESTPSLGEAFEGGVKLTVAALLPLGAVFALFPEPILRLIYGSEFDAAVGPLRWLAGATVIYGVGYLSATLLIAQGRQGLLPWFAGAVLVLNVALNLLLIPAYSYNATAAVTSLSELLLAAACVTAVVRLSGPVSVSRIAAGPMTGCLAIGAVALVAGTGLAALALAGVAYALVLVAVEWRLFPADVRGLRNSLRLASPTE
jgi:O-antigen/teichoic acid export membrane protein